MELTLENSKVELPKDPQAARHEKLKKIKELGLDPYPATFAVSHRMEKLQSDYADLADDTHTDDIVRVAGRITSSRNSGMFRDLTDSSGKIQIFSHKSSAPESVLAMKNLLDIGDFIGVEGPVRRTKTGELTINAQKITLLTKALLGLPEKHHGVTDPEIRQRNRTLDLLGNEGSRQVFLARSQAISHLRRLMEDEGFIEIETPVLHEIYGGATADPFTTHYNAIHQDMYLRIALELHLKRVLVGGLSDKLYEIGRVFRNEGVSTRHNPEFTMLEAYWAYADYEDVMGLVERLFARLAQRLHGGTRVEFGTTELDFSGPFERLPMARAVQEKTGVGFLQIADDAAARRAAGELGVVVEQDALWGECMEAVFGEKVESGLLQPTHITDFPKDISPLAKTHPQDPRLVERFETYVNGWELANAFSELNDPIEQRARMQEQMEQAHARGETSREMDEAFLTAIEQGMPPTGGLGIGIDRLIMLLTNSQTIRDVILFPALKTKAEA